MSIHEGDFYFLLNVNMCISMCRDNNYAYAGLQYHRQCFCDDVIPTVEVPASECNATCDGNIQQICGGTWRYSVYSTSKFYLQRVLR